MTPFTDRASAARTPAAPAQPRCPHRYGGWGDFTSRNNTWWANQIRVWHTFNYAMASGGALATYYGKLAISGDRFLENTVEIFARLSAAHWARGGAIS
jgi:hypothetical protein